MTVHAVPRVRVARSEDAPLLLPMFEAFYGAYFEPKTVEAIREHLAAASSIDVVLLAEDAGLPVGFASLRLLPQVESDLPHAELSDLFVEPSHRRRGVGRTLVAYAERLARDRGCPRIVLVTGFDNPNAQGFYEAMGFQECAVQMKKDLEEGA